MHRICLYSHIGTHEWRGCMCQHMPAELADMGTLHTHVDVHVCVCPVWIQIHRDA